MKFLVYSWIYEYTLFDILDAFNDLNIQYSIVKLDVIEKNKSDCPELYDLIYSSIPKDNYDAVFSINYFPDVAKACNDRDILYISWSYDCPLDIANVEKTISLPTNRAFFFDKDQYKQYLNDNNTVFHAPLGVNSKRLKNISFNPKYASEISFVGRVYHSSYPTIKKFLDAYCIGYLDGLINTQKMVYGAYLIKGALSDEVMEQINTDLKKHNSPFTQKEEVTIDQIATSLAMEATFENRLLYLGLLSKKFDLRWYTTPDSESLPHIKKCDPVDYKTQMPQVFNSSKINLHIGLHAISSGISLRQLDIMACGGFLLSSFQPELFDYFTPGEDFDYYSAVEEAYEKCVFYLNNEALRAQIALSGKEKVLECFDNKIILSEIIKTAFN